MIRIRKLRLVGAAKNYDVSFLDVDGKPRPLSIIAGEISTGKTSILDFIDYCLGRRSHPQQVEVRRQARVAQLEVGLDDEVVVLERNLFQSDAFVLLHRCRLDDLAILHETTRVRVDPSSDPKTLNWLLLRHSGLEGVVLREAPTQAESATDALSFRDVMWLAYLHADRLAAGQLLHEHQPMKRLKLRQLVEVIFGVHDQQIATLGDRIKRLDEERVRQVNDIDALKAFLSEQSVESRSTLADERLKSSRRIRRLRAQLEEIDGTMRAASGFAEAARTRYADARQQAGQIAAQVRDRESLLRRLLPLRGQYAEDERKLAFFSEAQRLFDPLSISACPACLQALDDKPAIRDQACSLCHSVIDADDQETAIDVEAERAAIRVRVRTLNVYVEEVESDLAQLRAAAREAGDLEERTQEQLDDDLAERLGPFVAERDRIVSLIESERARRREIGRQIGWWDAIDRRGEELAALIERIATLRAEQAELEASRPSHEAAVRRLSSRFASLLTEFGFPKLLDPAPPYLNRRFEPHVRDVPYAELRSRGATTLVALAWQLAVFELAVETGASHPGFLFLDSPQNGLKPTETSGDDFSGSAIAERVWGHLEAWTANEGASAQMIVVDNLPPSSVVDTAHIVVNYTGDPLRAPYGFIDNEAGPGRTRGSSAGGS